MSHFSESEDAFSDGSDGAHIRITRARPSSPSASNGAVAPHVPRVIRTAAAASRSTAASSRGYSPKVSVDMAVAHSWAPYAAVVSTLRSVSLLALKGSVREEAREAVAGLYAHPTPFGAAQRFPAGEVYVCLDRSPLARTMHGIQESLMKAEAGYGDKCVSACSSCIYGIGSALEELTRATRDDGSGAPVLYDREVFESAFLLTWTEP
ncbi:uncharacterized protein LOC124672894 [Lolium rigidum]|uniref:uncharacterized protein LOC124672894 n=1 Tax=Lolium rigidum TaxID=89674 RepID=UPI001F5DA91A|nr:uncharacterized protein LOC124672894 [Lolium rigidum]